MHDVPEGRIKKVSERKLSEDGVSGKTVRVTMPNAPENSLLNSVMLDLVEVDQSSTSGIMGAKS